MLSPPVLRCGPLVLLWGNPHQAFPGLRPSRCWIDVTGVKVTLQCSFPSWDSSFDQGQGKPGDLSNFTLGSSLRIPERKCGREEPVIIRKCKLPPNQKMQASSQSIRTPFFDVESKYIQITPKTTLSSTLDSIPRPMAGLISWVQEQITAIIYPNQATCCVHEGNIAWCACTLTAETT